MTDLSIILRKYIDNSLNIPKNTIYHFTKNDNYKKICEDQHLILNPHDFLNQKCPSNKELETAFDLTVNQMKLRKMNHLISNFEKIYEQGVTFYTASFSNNKAKALEKYGNNVIEIPISYVSRFITEHQDLKLLFCNVVYSRKKQKKIISELFIKFQRLCKNENDINRLITNLLLLLPIFKESTKENMAENESRLITYSMKDKDGAIYPATIKEFPIILHNKNY